VTRNLQSLCDHACQIVTECEARMRPQSVICRDAGTQSELAVRFVASAQGVAFVTDHVVPPAGLSCDWCVCHCDEQKQKCTGLLVELKGRDFRHAVQQLSSTHQALLREWPELKITRSIVVLSGKKIPSIKSTDYRIVGQCRLPGFCQYRMRKGLSVEV